MKTTIDVSEAVAARLDGDGKAALLEEVRARLADDHDRLEGWRSETSVTVGSVTFHRGLGHGFDVKLERVMSAALTTSPAPGRAVVSVEVDPSTRLFGVVGVPVTLLLAVGGVVFVIVAAEPVLGATARTLKKWIFGAVLLLALVGGLAASAIAGRIATGGRGNDFASDEARDRVARRVAGVLGGTSTG